MPCRQQVNCWSGISKYISRRFICVNLRLTLWIYLQKFIQTRGELRGEIAVWIEPADWWTRNVTFFVENHDGRKLVHAELLRNHSIRISQHRDLQTVLLRERSQLFVARVVLRFCIRGFSADPVNHHASIAVFVGELSHALKLCLRQRQPGCAEGQHHDFAPKTIGCDCLAVDRFQREVDRILRESCAAYQDEQQGGHHSFLTLLNHFSPSPNASKALDLVV